MFRSIEKIIGKSIPVLEEEHEIIQPVVTIQTKSNSERNKGNRNNNNRNKNRNGKSNYRSKSYNKNKPNKSSN